MFTFPVGKPPSRGRCFPSIIPQAACHGHPGAAEPGPKKSSGKRPAAEGPRRERSVRRAALSVEARGGTDIYIAKTARVAFKPKPTKPQVKTKVTLQYSTELHIQSLLLQNQLLFQPPCHFCGLVNPQPITCPTLAHLIVSH